MKKDQEHDGVKFRVVQVEAPENDMFDLMVTNMKTCKTSKSWNSLKIPANRDANLDIVHKIIQSTNN